MSKGPLRLYKSWGWNWTAVVCARSGHDVRTTICEKYPHIKPDSVHMNRIGMAEGLEEGTIVVFCSEI